MHAYLIVGNGEDFINQLVGSKLTFPFAKIEDVRKLNDFLRLKLTEKTVVMLNDFDKSSEEAQNAFLKALEEPQPNLTFILVATNIDAVLPTIVSRCEVREFLISNLHLTKEKEEEMQGFINSDVGEKLKFISKITKRDEAIKFANDLSVTSHQKLPEDWKVAQEALKLKRNLEANGNVSLQLTNFVVALQS